MRANHTNDFYAKGVSAPARFSALLALILVSVALAAAIFRGDLDDPPLVPSLLITATTSASPSGGGGGDGGGGATIVTGSMKSPRNPLRSNSPFPNFAVQTATSVSARSRTGFISGREGQIS